MQTPSVLWRPPPDVRETTRIGLFTDWAANERSAPSGGYDELWRWSVTELEAFWAAVWDFFAVTSQAPYGEVLRERVMPGARWFSGARLNWAEHALRLTGRGDDDVVIVARSQTRARTTLTRSALRDAVA